MTRTSGSARQSSPPIRRPEGSGNTGPRGSKNRPWRGKSTQDRVWGKTPRHDFDERGLTRLFEHQKRLNAALRRQARLAKLEVSEVRSTEVEILRRINEQIARGFADPVTGKNLFSDRNLTDAQMLSEQMLERQGTRVLISENEPRKPPTFHPPSLRRKVVEPSQSKTGKKSPPTELGTLRGVLLPAFRRAQHRGYRGPPSRWLKGPAASKQLLRLRQKGLIDPNWSGSLFCSNGPLFYMDFHGRKDVRFGFRDERLYIESEDPSVLIRQAASVPRLRYHEWPRTNGVPAWPTYPTLNESWICLMTGKSLPAAYWASEKAKLPPKRPTFQIKPGMSVRTIASFVRGIRADTPVARKFLPYFKYRWGFLILRRDRPLPKDLVSFLTRLWKSDITKMFLVYPIRYNDALRRMPSIRFYRILGFVPPASISTRRGSRRAKQRWLRRKCRSSDPEDLHDTSSESERGVRLC